MRIAQVSPLHESVPPKLYGGTERVVSFLTEALVDLGHDVTLFASGDSVTRARLVPCAPRALRLDEGCRDPLAHHLAMLEEVFTRAAEFDVIHFHLDYLSFPRGTPLQGSPRRHHAQPARRSGSAAALSRRSPTSRWCRSPTRSRRRCRSRTGAGPCTTGCRSTSIRSGPNAGTYLAFLGRVSPEKGVHHAVEIARRLGLPLKVAAKIDDRDRELLRTPSEAALRSSPRRVPGRDRRGRKGRASWATRPRCCFPSTGRSRSGW